ncbi:MAG TPA: hypothetical protein VID72_00100 [Ktedonobacterales bacterium]|jgi:DNA-binding transcriptional regulator GbsR (MarR family)
MADPEHLSAEQREYIESLGVFFAHFGLPRLVGRLLGLLMLSDRPLTLDDMAQALLVSRASVSTNIRIALHNEYVVRVGIAGDRRDFYRFSDEVWERRTQLITQASSGSRVMAERGLATLGPGDVLARERLEEMREYCDFSIEEAHNMVARWRKHKQAARAASARARQAPATHPALDHSSVPSAGAPDETVAMERNR